MRITPINYNFFITPSFKSNGIVTKNEKDEVVNRNTTFMFRNDIGPWDKFADYLIDKYKNTDKVNVCCYACSDGSEPVSLALILSEKCKDGAKKYFPIIAKDRDDNILKDAVSGELDIYQDDLEMINAFTDNKLLKYFHVIPKKNEDVYGRLKVKDNLRKEIVYERTDFVDDIHKIPRENTVLMCRNFWPYLEDRYTQSRLIENLSHRLGENSVIVVGNFDNETDVPKELMRAGFIETAIPFVFEAPKKGKFYL